MGVCQGQSLIGEFLDQAASFYQFVRPEGLNRDGRQFLNEFLNESNMTGMLAAGMLATPGDENEHTRRA